MAITTLNLRGINRSDTASSGQVITATSAVAADFQDAGGGGLVLLNTASFTSSAYVTIISTGANAFSTYKTHRLIFRWLGTHSSGGLNLEMTLSNDAGSSWEAGTDYHWIQYGGFSTHGSAVLTNGNGVGYFQITRDSCRNDSYSYSDIYFHNLVSSASNTYPTATWTTSGTNHDGATAFHNANGAGHFAQNNAIDGIKINASVSALTGDYAWYGVKEA